MAAGNNATKQRALRSGLVAPPMVMLLQRTPWCLVCWLEPKVRTQQKRGGQATAGVDGLLLSALHCGSGEWSSSPKKIETTQAQRTVNEGK